MHKIETKNLSFSYRKLQKDIENLNLEIPDNSIYGFLGPNGSGKSTTIKLLLGLLNNSKSNIYYNEKAIKNNRIAYLAKIGSLIEGPSLYEHLTALENLKIAARYRKNVDASRCIEVLKIVKLDHVDNKRVNAFSMGMKQRLGIAIALLSQPEFLILDEPTNGLDPKGIHEMRDLINTINKNYGATVLISSHLLSEIEKLCTHVGIIKDGKLLFQNTVEKLKKSQQKKLRIELETDDASMLAKELKSLNLEYEIVNKNIVEVTVASKMEIPQLIDNLRLNMLAIYQVKIKNNLEDLFLQLTEN